MKRLSFVRLRQWQPLRNVVLLAGATGIAQAMTVLVSPILTRLYSPEQFGVFGLFMAILSILTVAASLRYEVALPMADEGGSAANLLILCFATVVILSSVVAVAVLFFARPLAAGLGAESLGPYLWLLPIALAAAGAYQVLSFWAVREKAYSRVARTRLTRSLWMIVTQLGLGLSGIGPLGLLLGGLVGQTTGLLTLANSLRVEWKQEIAAVDLRSMSAVARRYRNFPLFSCGAGLLGASAMNAPVLLITMLFGLEIAGLLALAQRVVGAPMQLLGGAVTQVFLGDLAELKRKDRAVPLRLFMKVAKILTLVGALILGPLILFGPALFTLAFGAEWRASGVFVQLLAAGFLARFIVAPLAQCLVVLERQDLQLIWDVGRVCLVVLAFMIAHQLEWSPIQAVAAYSVATGLSYGAMFAILLQLIRRAERSRGCS